jgi:hypothetical protein
MISDALLLDLIAARHNLWEAQKRFNYFADLYVSINDEFTFNFKDQAIYLEAEEPYLKFYMAPELLEAILNRTLHWNNLELSFRVEVDRKPNKYEHDAHLLMSFFHTPAPRG